MRETHWIIDNFNSLNPNVYCFMEGLSLNYFDLIIGIILLWSAYRGVRKGFLIMAASLAALILGVWGAIRFSHLTAALLISYVGMQTQYLGLISFALTFVLIVLLVHLLSRALDKLVKAVALGPVNRVAGLLFGLLKSAFLISIFLVIIKGIDRRIPFIPEEHKENSLLFQPLSRLAPAIFPFLNFEEIRDKIPDRTPKGIEA
jgi:membrane protein required for colicin V production